MLMAMFNIKEGTFVFVPWRIQGIVRNEERVLNYSLHLLEKQHKYLINCLTRDQIMATNKLEGFLEKFGHAPRVSVVMSKCRMARSENKSGAVTTAEDGRPMMSKMRPWLSNTATGMKQHTSLLPLPLKSSALLPHKSNGFRPKTSAFLPNKNGFRPDGFRPKTSGFVYKTSGFVPNSKTSGLVPSKTSGFVPSKTSGFVPSSRTCTSGSSTQRKPPQVKNLWN